MEDSLNKTSFYNDIRKILQSARSRAYTAVNTAMVEAYWLIGKRIVEEEQNGEPRAKYGKKLLENLSRSLGNDFGKGFSYANLRNFRQFYLTYPDQEICYTVCSKLSWSHNRLIMRIDSHKARDYYLREAAEQQWSVRQLQRNVNTLYYERLLSTQQDQIKEIVQPNTGQIPAFVNGNREFIKDPYVLEFLQLADDNKHHEKDIETAIINNLSQFLLEAGKGFSFVGRQYRISTETNHFYIDLVFYNYLFPGRSIGYPTPPLQTRT